MSYIDLLRNRIVQRDYTVGIIGLGYVGLPLVRGRFRATTDMTRLNEPDAPS